MSKPGAGVVARTNIMRPGGMFQRQHFHDTLISLLSPPEVETPDLTGMDVPEDVVPN